MEQMQYNLLFRWFVGLGIDDPVWGEGRPEICPVGLLKKSFQTDAVVGRAGRFSINNQISTIAGTSFLRFIAMAVMRAWIFMFSSPLRTAWARPWSVLAVPCAPSTCHRWPVAIVGTIDVGHFGAKLPRIESRIDPHQHMAAAGALVGTPPLSSLHRSGGFSRPLYRDF